VASGSRRYVETVAESHLAAALAVVEELGVSAELLGAVPTRILPDSAEVAA
jgi:geranylgeranyl diphosphate synthase type II